MMDRRHFLKHCLCSSSSLLANSLLPKVFASRVGDPPHFFIFIHANGGWDTTFSFEVKLGSTTIESDPNGQEAIAHGIPYVDNSIRPSVKRVLDDFGDRCCVINGMLIRSISHDIGTRLLFSGLSDTSRSDWPTLIAFETAVELLMPHLHLSGPVYPGDLGSVTTSGAGFTEFLFPDRHGVYVPSASAAQSLDQYIAGRLQGIQTAAANLGINTERLDGMALSYERLSEMESRRDEIDFGSLQTLADEGRAAVDSFERGLSIAATMEAVRGGNFDSHQDNNDTQNVKYEEAFDGIHQILTDLASRTGTTGTSTMLDQTTIVVFSEMSRTPKINNEEGKDHWPYTSVLLIGGGVKGGTVLGETDDTLSGLGINFESGVLETEGRILSSANLGAGLLDLAGIDSNLYLPGIEPFRAFKG